MSPRRPRRQVLHLTTPRPVADFMPPPVPEWERPEPVKLRYAAEPDAGDSLVAHGYTLRHIDQLARIPGRRCFGSGRSVSEMFDLARGGIVEALLAAAEKPSQRDLIDAGLWAVQKEWKQDAQSHGRVNERGMTPQPHARFEAYWIDFCNRSRWFPEDRIVEGRALVQILPHLSENQQRALVALAAMDGDAAAAADALGVPVKTMQHHVREGRHVFARLWFEHETPPRGPQRVTTKHAATAAERQRAYKQRLKERKAAA